MCSDFSDINSGNLLRALREAGAGPSLEEENSSGLSPALAELTAEGGSSAHAALETIKMSFNDSPDYDDPEEDLSSQEDQVIEETAARREHDDEVGRQPEKLLDRLFDKGVLPRYAFPTDVVAFNVFDQIRSADSRRPVLRYSPQQGLNQALSSYAPGKEVWVNGKKHYSLALWSPFKRRDCKRAWYSQKLYFECEVCGYAKIEERDDENFFGKTIDCPACGSGGACGPAKRWLRPAGFAHPVDQNVELPSGESPPPTRSSRAKLSADYTQTRPDYTHRVGGAKVGYDILTDKQELVLTNTGSHHQSKPGFLYCLGCGRIEPNGWEHGRLHEDHRVPYPDKDQSMCGEKPRPVVLGNKFRTDIALIRFYLGDSVALPPGAQVTKICLTTVAEALSSSVARLLEIEPADVGAEFRVAMTAEGRLGKQVEVYLYDHTPGGAGFVSAAVASHEHLFREAIQSLKHCDCSHSCYQCLRSYKNRWDHKYLNRHLARSFLEYCLDGVPPQNSEEEEDRILMALSADLEDEDPNQSVERLSGGLRLRLAGAERVITLAHPLTAKEPGSSRALELARVNPNIVTIDLLKADLALPAAVKEALGVLDQRPNKVVKPSLPEASSGCPLYDIE